MYADDIVILAETERDLQISLNALNGWCCTNDMVVNGSKSNVIHFRNPSVCRTNFTFQCGNNALRVVDRYMPLRHRSAFAKFRCGVAPLRIETGRYENKP